MEGAEGCVDTSLHMEWYHIFTVSLIAVEQGHEIVPEK